MGRAKIFDIVMEPQQFSPKSQGVVLCTSLKKNQQADTDYSIIRKHKGGSANSTTNSDKGSFWKVEDKLFRLLER